MSTIRNMTAEANRVKRGKAKSRKLALGISVDEAKVGDELEKLPTELREKVLVKAIRAAGGVVRTEMRRRLRSHRSSRTGTASKWSESIQRRRQSREKDLYKATAVRVKNYPNKGRVIAYVGYRRPYGNHGHLLEYGATIRDGFGKGIHIQVPPNPIMRPAIDATREQQTAEAVKKVRQEWAKL